VNAPNSGPAGFGRKRGSALPGDRNKRILRGKNSLHDPRRYEF
jgi:hypothetical protein